MLPHLGPDTADALRDALRRTGYTPDGVRNLLGPAAHAALGRGEPEPAARASRDGGELGVLVRLLLLGAVEPDPAVAAALAPLAPADAAAAGLLRRDGDRLGGRARPAPLRRATGADWWVLSDLDARRQQRDHVTGVGAASLTLAAATVRRPAALAARPGHRLRGAGPARHPVRRPGDRHRRRAAGAGHGPGHVRAQRAGRRAAGRAVAGPGGRAPVRPDRVQPAVRPGPAAGRLRLPRLRAGRRRRAGRAAAATWPRTWNRAGWPSCSAPGCTWRGEDWPDRVRSWLPPGVDAWVLQREVADPALHVGTWQRDAGLDPAAPATREQAGAWLDWLARERVQAVGFGHLTLRRTEGAPTVVFEDLSGDLDDPLGPEVEGWLDRVDWLRAHAGDAELLAARLAVAPTVLLESYAEPGADGWAEVGAAVARQDGPRWRHEVDGPAAALLAGCQGALPLGELVELLALAHDRPTGELVAATPAGAARAGPARPAGAGRGRAAP